MMAPFSPPATAPFLTRLDRETLTLEPRTGRYVKTLRELDGLYADERAFQALAERDGNAEAYRVDELRLTEGSHDLITGLSVLKPGRVGDEFFMTRGHLHRRADRPETYFCVEGHGVMLTETLSGEACASEMRPGTLVYVPPYHVHRSVNVGTGIFATLFSYPSDAGQDFDIVRTAGGFAQLIVTDGGTGWRTVPNASYRPRAPEEVRRRRPAGATPHHADS